MENQVKIFCISHRKTLIDLKIPKTYFFHSLTRAKKPTPRNQHLGNPRSHTTSIIALLIR